MKDCTLCIIRPHSIISGKNATVNSAFIHFLLSLFLSGHAGKIIQDIIREGYTITDLELFHLDRSNAEEFLEVYKGVVPEYHVSSL